jgi:hypothetical protein
LLPVVKKVVISAPFLMHKRMKKKKKKRKERKNKRSETHRHIHKGEINDEVRETQSLSLVIKNTVQLQFSIQT